MAQTIVGIDIGSYSIKIAEIERTFSAFELVQFYERKIQYNELLTKEESLAVTLQGMIDDFGLTWDQVICGYPGHKITSRLITMPFGNLKKVDQTIEFEVESYVPFDLEELVMDYHVIHNTKESSDVLVFYTLKEEFSKWFQFLQNSRIDPKIVTVEVTEFLNCVYTGMIPPETPYVIIDMGHSKTNVTVCKGKKLNYVRSIALGGKHITENIAKKCGVPEDEAERLKIEMGSIPSEEDQEAYDDLSSQVGAAIKEIIDDIAVQIRQILFAYKDVDGDPVEGLYLTGGSTRIPGMDRHLSSLLKQNATFIDPMAFHFCHLGKATTHKAMMGQAVAIALRGVASRGMPTLNLRQGEFAYKGDIAKVSGTLRHVAIAVGLIFVLGLTYFGVKYYVLSKQVEAFNTEVAKLVKESLGAEAPKNIASLSGALKSVKSKKAAVAERIETVQGMESVLILDILKDISQKVPGREAMRLDIEEMTLKGGRMSLKGLTDSFISVDKIKSALENSPYLENVSPGSTRKGMKEDEYKFEMTMDLFEKEKKKGKKGRKRGKKS